VNDAEESSPAFQPAEGVRAERDRFVALAFCWADVLLELDPGETVIFAAGATLPLLGHQPGDLIGRPFHDLVAPEDRSFVRGLLGIASKKGRIENVSVRMQSATGATAPLPFAGYRLDDLGTHFFLAFRVGTATPRKGTSGHLTRDTGSGLFDTQSFTEIANHALTSAREDEAANQMTLIALADYEDLRQRLSTKTRQDFLNTVGACLRAKSLDGDAAARIADDRYGLLHGADLDVADLETQVAEISRDIDPAGQGTTVESATVHHDHDGASDEDVANGLIYAINRFRTARGSDFTIKSLSTSMSSLVSEAVKSVTDFKQVVAAESFNVAFQPIINAVTGEVHHYEALARFGAHGPEQSPYEYISFAEETGLIQEFDLAMVGKVTEWLSRTPRDRDYSVAVNVSGHSVASSSYVAGLHTLLRNNIWTRGRLMFEITESARMDDLVVANRFINGLRSEGYKVCLDDFGAGAANFQYLSTLEVDVVKFDGLAVRNAESAPKGKAFLRALATLCRGLGVETIAEMVDNAKSLEFIRECGVNYVQGYLFGLPATDVGTFDDQIKPRLFPGRPRKN
jgi:EAL domain-containing protein (putative c-di-GMP-specific phosphodiesterase class I)